jgi:hypothetical protein
VSFGERMARAPPQSNLHAVIFGSALSRLESGLTYARPKTHARGNVSLLKNLCTNCDVGVRSLDALPLRGVCQQPTIQQGALHDS